MRKFHRAAPPIFVSSLPLLMIACQTSYNGRRVHPADDDTFPNASVFAQEEIDKKLSEIPYLRGRQVVDACVSIAQIGPAAIPKLTSAAKDDHPMRRTFVMNVLGAIGDRRALPTLIKALNDGDNSVRYEAARSCARMGDWTNGIPVLISGLRDASLYARTLCFDALKKQTNYDFGYNPKGNDTERAASCEKWETWWEGHRKATIDMRRS